ncbi:MAG: hypothetical protein H7Y03_01040 [Chitinophagaceae bacterium]|nr:hypothetical protein [Chitinophagaceae bacterium]
MPAEGRDVLVRYKADLKNKMPRPAYQPRAYSKEDILDTIQKGILTMASPLMGDEDKGWFADNMAAPPADDKHKLRKTWYASYNRGVAGILYTLAQANTAGLDTSATNPFIARALDLIRDKYISRIAKAKTGLHFGSDGIAASLATAVQQGLIKPTTQHMNWIGLLLEKENLGSDIVNGGPGQGIAVMISAQFLGQQMVNDRLRSIAQKLIARQDKDGSWATGYYRQKLTRRKIKRATRGFMEGLSGAIYFLLEYGYRYSDTASKEAATRGLKWLMNKAKHSKGTVTWKTASNKEMIYGLSDGVAGLALTFIKAYQHTGLPVYRDYAVKALRSIPEDLTDSNITQRNGLSGLGEVYLEAYTVLDNEEWLDRAGWIAQVIMNLKKLHPKYGTYWLADHERQPVANFMVGNSGVMHFLLRYCHPSRISLPMMEKQPYTSFDTFQQPDKSISVYEPAPTA